MSYALRILGFWQESLYHFNKNNAKINEKSQTVLETLTY